MNKYIPKLEIFDKKLILFILKILIFLIPLSAYKYVYEFRINQEMILILFTVVALTLWIINTILKEEYIWFSSKINISIYLFILIMTISLFRTNYFYPGFNDYLIFLAYFILYFLIINNINEESNFNSFLKLFFITSALISIYTILHYYGLIPYLREFGPVVSPIGQKNWTSNYIGLIFPLILSLFLIEDIKKIKVTYFIILSINYITLMICQSRGIWISICITLIIAFYFIFKFKLSEVFKQNKKWLIVLLSTFLIITFIYSTDNPLNKSAITVTERAISTFDEQDPSINTRLLIWNTTFNMIQDNTIFGIGIGTFKINYLDYQAHFLKNNYYYLKYSTNAREAHNEYLQIGAELGIIGMGIFLSILFIFYIIIAKYFNQESNNRKKIIVFGLSLGIICFLIHSLFTFPLHVPALGSSFFIIISLTIVYIKNIDSSYPNKKIRELKIINSKLKTVAIIIILIVILFLVNSLVVKPYISELYYFKGMGYNNDKDYTEALDNLKYAVRLDPYNGRILHALGSTYYNLSLYNKSEINLKNSIKYSIDVKSYYNLGLVYFQTGFYKKAEGKFKYTIYLDPKFTKAYLKLAYLCAKQKEYDKAILNWNKILEIEPDFSEKYTVLYYLGLTYIKKEMSDKALEYFIQALQLVPEDSPILEEIEKEIYNIYKDHLDK